MEHFVLPHIGSVVRGEPCLVVVMDNCNIHYSADIVEAIRDRGGIVIFLPKVFLQFDITVSKLILYSIIALPVTLIRNKETKQKLQVAQISKKLKWFNISLSNISFLL